MSVIDTARPKSVSYSHYTLERAKRSLICSPFKTVLFEKMRASRVPMSDIAGSAGFKNGYSKRELSELMADNSLAWLIQVGILRREVDGQGITDSFRLTPLGRQLVEQLQKKDWSGPTWGDYLLNAITCWFRVPF
ncbi:MAG: hypothetical protein HC908_12210 [Calothrix sp. SM1_7_51]|nr:hypothetical protein [Calothrix sp. SM1_7_51]